MTCINHITCCGAIALMFLGTQAFADYQACEFVPLAVPTPPASNCTPTAPADRPDPVVDCVAPAAPNYTGDRAQDRALKAQYNAALKQYRSCLSTQKRVCKAEKKGCSDVIKRRNKAVLSISRSNTKLTRLHEKLAANEAKYKLCVDNVTIRIRTLANTREPLLRACAGAPNSEALVNSYRSVFNRIDADNFWCNAGTWQGEIKTATAQFIDQIKQRIAEEFSKWTDLLGQCQPTFECGALLNADVLACQIIPRINSGRLEGYDVADRDHCSASCQTAMRACVQNRLSENEQRKAQAERACEQVKRLGNRFENIKLQYDACTSRRDAAAYRTFTKISGVLQVKGQNECVQTQADLDKGPMCQYFVASPCNGAMPTELTL